MQNATAYHGLEATFTPDRVKVRGSGTIGTSQLSPVLTSVTDAVAFQVEVDAGGSVDLDLSTMIPALSGTGQAQVTSMALTGTATGTETVTVAVNRNGAIFATVDLPVTTGQSAATIAGNLRTALNDSPEIVDAFTVGGAGATVTLEPIEAGPDDPTFGISAPGLSTLGITPDASSTITPGIAPTKCFSLPGTTFAGENYEGGVLISPIAFFAIEIATTGILDVEIGDFTDKLASGEILHKHAQNALSFSPSDHLILSADGGYASVTVILMYR